MELLLVAGCAVTGAVAGAILDPIGQRLADRSRADERHATDGGRPEPGTSAAAGTPARTLLRPGPSPLRTAAAAMATGALFAAVAVRSGTDLVLAPFCVFVALLVVVSVTDLTHHLVPRRLLYPGVTTMVLLLVATAAIDQQWHHLVDAAVAGVVAFAFFFAIWWFVPQGMGFGDVRLAGVIGIGMGYLSLVDAYLAFLIGFVAGMVLGLATMAVRSSDRRAPVPFAPALALGAVVTALGWWHVG